LIGLAVIGRRTKAVTLHINEAEVKSVLNMPLAIEAVETISRKQATGEVLVHSRRRFELPGGAFFHHMAAADVTEKLVATKQYTYVGGKLKFVVSLFSTESGDLLSLIEADVLGQMRTGAASGVATKYLARADARTAAMVGTGGQARTQLEAIAAVRKLDRVRVYGRDEERRKRFALEMSAKLGVSVEPAASSEVATEGAAIVCTATTAGHAVVGAAAIQPGTHINAIGANHMKKRELDAETVAKCDRIFVDSIEQSRQESGDLVLGFAGHEKRWDAVRELSSLVAGICPGRSDDSQITLFKSNGISAWDLAAAAVVYRMAKERGLGRTLPFWQNA
jgi:ornithine cyclodeaminase/alanine dehydrogenase-like protein (mu-crystallin family)